MSNIKQCTKCKIIKPILSFYACKKCKDGLAHQCIQCHKEAAISYRERNREAVNKRSRDYYASIDNSKESNKEKIKKYRENNKEKILEYQKKYQKNNKEKLRKLRKKYKENNKEKIKKYRENNKEKIRDKDRLYRKSENGIIAKRNAENKRRYLKRINSDGTIPLSVQYPLNIELIKLLEAQEYKCNNCNCDITHNKQLDHHIPLSKGGTHSIDNIVWLCQRCNLTKGSKIPKTLLLI